MSALSLRSRHLFFGVMVVCGGVLASQANAGLMVGHVIDKNGQPAADAVVYATPIDLPIPAAKTGTTAVVAQEKTTFVPYVSAIRTGTLVSFPNRDPYDHHVKSLSPTKTFEARIDAKKEGPKPIKFDKAGEVALVCFFHDSMRGFIYVVDTPYFGTTDKAGNVVLNDLPAGRYEVRAWAPSMIGATLLQSVQIPQSGPATNVQFKFDFVPKPAPAPRAPAQNATY